MIFRAVAGLGAYEQLWLESPATFKRLAERFAASPNKLPSELVEDKSAAKELSEILLKRLQNSRFGVRIFGTNDYPSKLRDAKYPVEMLYFVGNWNLVHTPSIAVVGTRKPSEDGIKRCKKLTRLLVENGYTIVSGLAKGIDTVALSTAIAEKGHTVGVIGTPITEFYPPDNKKLQQKMEAQHLVVSQIPIFRYENQDWRVNRGFFPERNKTMSALSLATVIVEASETSGTLTQAKAALRQNRQLFILDSCFTNPDITWPEKFQKLGAIRVKDISDILRALNEDS